MVLAVCANASAREGFGFTKKAADMKMTVPPAINVIGTRVALDVKGDRARELERSIADLIERAGTALKVATPADIHVSVDVDRVDVDHDSRSKVEYVSEQRCCDKNGKKYSVSVPRTKYYTTVEARLAAEYKITDAKGKVLDDGDVDDSWTKDYDYTVPSSSETEEALVARAARRVAARIVPTQSKVTVLVPKGSFESFIPLAESNSWDRYLQSVEAVAPMRDPASEAYRQYALAVAKEGLAYAADDVKRARELLREAAAHYRTAIQSNPAEKLFSEEHFSLFSSSEAPLPRVEASVKAFEAWVPAGTTAVPKIAETSKGEAKKSSSSSKRKLGNQGIIDMKKAGLSDENIKLAIDGADATSFDTSPEGLIALSKAGVSNDVILHMQKRTR